MVRRKYSYRNTMGLGLLADASPKLTKNWALNKERIKQAERFDGYYTIVTNNLNLSTAQVCQAYREIWKIEESLRTPKTDLRACPIFVRNDEHV